MLLPTDQNKLLMQWKIPYEVSAVVGTNDYKVKIKDKLKVYHAKLLKNYIEREEEKSGTSKHENFWYWNFAFTCLLFLL